MVLSPFCDGEKVHQQTVKNNKKKKTLKSVSETCTCLVRIHVLVCPFLSDPWIFVLCSLEMHMIASSLLGLA